MGQTTVQVHYCFNQHLGQQKPENCLCRKEITYAEAEGLVGRGQADWLVLSRTPVPVDQIGTFNVERGRYNPPLSSLDREDFMSACPVCARKNDAQKKNCPNCHGRGYRDPVIYWEELSRWQLPEPGGQLVMTSQADEKGRFGLALHKKTPRVATVESKHIVRAILDGRWEALARIEDYHRVNMLELYGKPVKAPLNEKTIEFTLEPEDVPGDRTHDAQGRKYDWGRAVIW